MGYLKTYNYFYTKANNIVKRKLVEEFQEAKKKSKNYNTLHNNILNWINSYRKESFSNEFETKYKEPFLIFKNRGEFYESDNPEDLIKWVLEGEMENCYDNNRYPYKKFVADLALSQSLEDISRHFQNYRLYYQLVYRSGMYEYFYLKDFERILPESSVEYKTMRNSLYSERAKEELNLPDTLPKSIEKYTPKELEDISKVNSKLKLFNNDEKLLLLNILKTHGGDMSTAEFIRICLITNGLFDYKIFTGVDYKNTAIYRKVSEGVSYSEKIYNEEFLNELKFKLEGMNVPIISQELNRLLAKKTFRIT
ncbi:hypothetical protein [Mangrovimonas sp. YM274]|uniref:hypothetical protein n=1 Tax=Mangrovimonas sp. YM274 TaxID=3070660 RepID=UPI0027DBABA6|nr:hypothetical protein [Mangrovimonas sp. YM274]WMI70253.1 hypothetical protein RBH95_07840 [Mangrovimonas sp. YM274]